MHRSLRRSVAAGIVSLALAGVPGPAVADAHPCPTQEELEAAHQTARDAKQAFLDTRRPLGHQVRVWRHELRVTQKSAPHQRRDLRVALRSATTDEERAAIAEQLAQLRSEVREARSLLGSKRALLAEIKQSRRVARAAWFEARSAWQDLQAQAETCAEPPAEEKDEPETAPDAVG